MQEILNNATEEKIYSTLDKLNIKYDRVDHKPVFTAEEAKASVTGLIEGIRCKNLFLQDTKKNYYLYFITDTKKADLKWLRTKINSSRLSFASEDKLYEMLKLTRGSVTPLGVINDESNSVIVLLDKDNKDTNVLLHPQFNTTTLSIKYSDLIRFIEYCGNKYIEI